MYERPIDEQIGVAKNMVSSFGALFKNVPMLENTNTSYSDGYAFMTFGEYEIWWVDGETHPKEFTIYVQSWTPGSYWEPPDCDVIELGKTSSLYEAMLFVAKHSVEEVYKQYMEGEMEYSLYREMESVEAEMQGWEADPHYEAGYAYACGYHD